MDVAIKDASARRQRRPFDTIEVTAPATVPPPTPEAVAIRAFELFLARGGEHGGDVEDWLRAERELAETATTTRLYES